MAGKWFARVAAEWLIWQPLWLVYSMHLELPGKLGLAAAMAACIAAGLALNRLPGWARRISLIAAFAVLLGAGIVRFAEALPFLIGLGAMLWRGRYVRFGHWQYAFGFGLVCLGLAAVSATEAWKEIRLPLILLGIFWVLAWFVALNRSLVDRAGLDNGIVTGTVRKAGRKYLFVFLAVGSAAIALTAGYGERLLTPRQNVDPGYEWIDPERFIQPPRQMNNPMEGMFPDEPAEPSPLWDYLFWVVLALAACGAVWFAILLWRDRNWTFQGLLSKLRSWFLRENREEKLPYVEERRSLRKPKAERGLIESWFRRQGGRPDWSRLDAAGKVRRLYEDTVLAGIGQGYGFKPGDTPSETLRGIERWRADGKASGNAKAAGYWQRVLAARHALLRLYEKARYSPHAVEEKEANELKRRLAEQDDERGRAEG